LCGICGFMGIEDAAILRRMNDSLVHRGPDDSGTFVDAGVGLGHRRLSIIDLGTGHQPMSNEEGTIWIVFNGEIYNYRELRKELLPRHRFATSSDTEVIVHLYEEDPVHFAERLDGMFALAIYDQGRKRLTLARDPFGKKPLYYALHEGSLYFASEIKALLQAEVPKKVNRESLLSFLGYQYTRGLSTMFHSIEKLPASHILVFESGKVSLRQYWDLREDIKDVSETEAVENIRKLLDASAKKRMVADVHIGAYLSGGIDSSGVVALSRPIADYEFHTFSLGFSTVSELPYAKMVADHLGTDHHEIIVDDGKVVQAMDQMAYHHDEPVGDAAILNNYLLSHEARKYVKVVLAGDGGDELFAGYDNYARCKYVHKVRSKAVLGRILPWLAHQFPGRGDLRRDWAEKELTMLEEGDIDRRLSLSTREMSPRELSWITGQKDLDLESVGWRHPGFHSDLNIMLYNDCRNRMGENYLMKTDKANMANSVEVRLPLLDRYLAEYAFTLPSKMKLQGGTEKYILRQALRDRLPQSILERKKMGFSTPVSDWMRGEIGEAAVGKVAGSELIRSCTDPSNLRKWVAQAEARKLRRPRAFWNLYALALWHETYFL